MSEYFTTTAMVDAATRYDYNSNTGIYIGGSGSGDYILLWFDGDSRDEQVASIDRLIRALTVMRTMDALVDEEAEAVPA